MRAVLRARKLEDRFEIDSAGTASYHVGELPDERTRATARRRGVELTHRARQVSARDFEHFDWLVCMDAKNVEALRSRAPSDAARAKIVLFRAFDPSAKPDAEVPDPYYGGPEGFEDVLDMCERASVGLVEHLTGRDL